MRLHSSQGSWLISAVWLSVHIGQPHLLRAQHEDVSLTADAPTEIPHQVEQHPNEDVSLAAEAPTEAPHEVGERIEEDVSLTADAPTEAPHEVEQHPDEDVLLMAGVAPEAPHEVEEHAEQASLPSVSEENTTHAPVEEEDEGPPSPAPAPPGTPIAHFAKSTKEVWRAPRRLHSIEPNQHDLTKHERKVAGVVALQAAGIEFTTGAWAYGDLSLYVSDEGPVECAHRCEEEPKCRHWNYYCKTSVCEFKSEQGMYEDGDAQFGRHYILTGETTHMRRLRTEKTSRADAAAASIHKEL